MSVQAIDDSKSVTIASASTVVLAESLKGLKKMEQSQKVGEAIAKVLADAGIKKAVCDRNGFRYHGRVAALVESVRTAGIQI